MNSSFIFKTISDDFAYRFRAKSLQILKFLPIQN